MWTYGCQGKRWGEGTVREFGMDMNTMLYLKWITNKFLLGGVPLAGILYSYSRIVSSICEISSAQGKYKAFSTCASHLSVVSLFYCTCLGVYLSSAATQSSHSSATASVMYTVVTPMLNPFIYSLRNKDIKTSLKAFFRRTMIKTPVVLSWRREHDWKI